MNNLKILIALDIPIILDQETSSSAAMAPQLISVNQQPSTTDDSVSTNKPMTTKIFLYKYEMCIVDKLSN